MTHPITPNTNSDVLELDELDLILAELQGNMVNIPATMKAKALLTQYMLDTFLELIDKPDPNNIWRLQVGWDERKEFKDELRKAVIERLKP